jgi:hypothetical protein
MAVGQPGRQALRGLRGRLRGCNADNVEAESAGALGEGCLEGGAGQKSRSS